jgi:hypothetical protein
MIVKDAKAIAHQWVMEQATQLPGFEGAFYHGSSNWLAEDATLPATSDLDVMVVLADPDSLQKPGKLIEQGVMLEVSYLAADQLQSAEQVLGQYHMAGSFHTPSIIADPSGHLTKLQEAVSHEYAKRKWVYRRCEDVRHKILSNLASLGESAPFHDQVTTWLFATGVTTHMLLVAGLKNPTVRKRYVAVRELLGEYDRLDFYEPLLELLGCAQLSRARVAEHLAALAEVFDATKTVVKTPFFFAADISDLARPVAIDGSRELIEQGLHREAIFWMVATYCRCQKVLAHDAPKQQAQFEPGFRRLVADLGITSFADLQRRSDETKAFLPNVWEVAQAILVENPAIEDEPTR